VYETQPAVAVRSRREVLAMAAAYGVPLVPAHPHVPLRVTRSGPVAVLLTAGREAGRCPVQQL